MVDAPTLLPEGRPDDKTRLGYVMVATAATLFAVNGSVSKVVLGSGLSSLELAQIRNTCAAILFLAFLLAVAPSRLRVGPPRALFLVAFGLVGIALVQWLYFVAIENLPVGVALLIEFTAPLFVALFARFVYNEHIRRRIWVAVAHVPHRPHARRRALGGGRLQHGRRHRRARRRIRSHRLPPHGRARTAAPRRCLALVLRLPVRGAPLGGDQPLWNFPWDALGDDVSLQGNLSEYSAPVWALVGFIVVIGTMVTFSLLVGALRHISATKRVDRRQLEPVVATVIAWAWLGETFGADAAHRRRRRHRRDPRRAVRPLTRATL